MVDSPSAEEEGLPARTEAAEEAFVARWRDHGASEDSLLTACQQAVAARRFMLAARLVSMLPEREGEGEALTRARQASRLVVMRRLQPEDVSWSSLTRLWASRNQHRRMSRNRARWRKARGLPPGRGRRR